MQSNQEEFQRNEQTIENDFKGTTILVFDVSETLQTELPVGDGYAEKTVGDFGVRYTTLIGGKKTADLLNLAQQVGFKIYIATNNGGNELINAKLEFQKFLLRYGFDLEEGHYCSNVTTGVKEKLKDLSCEKYQILDYICEKEDANKSQILFFDDSKNNIEGAREAGYTCIHVQSQKDDHNETAINDLHIGIQTALVKKLKNSNPATSLLDNFVKNHRLDFSNFANVQHWLKEVTWPGGKEITLTMNSIPTVYKVPSSVAETYTILCANESAEIKIPLIQGLVSEGSENSGDTYNFFKAVKNSIVRGDAVTVFLKDACNLKKELDELNELISAFDEKVMLKTYITNKV